MKKGSAAKRYAKALIGIGKDEGVYEKYGEELRGVVSIFNLNPVLYKILLNPMYKFEVRVSIVDGICDKIRVSQTMRKFLLLLVERRNVKLLEAISGAYQAMEDELSGRIRVKVFAAGEVDLKLIEEKLKRETKKEVIISFDKNPLLIGGILIKIGNTVLDGTILSQLERMREKLLEGVI